MKSAVITPAQRQLEDDIKAVVKNFDDQIAAIDRELPTIDRELEQLRAEYVRIWGDSDGDARRFSNRGQADIAEFEYDRARIKLAARKSELEGERTSLLKQREARVRTLIDSRPYGPSIPVAAFQLPDFASDPQLQELRHRREAVAVSVGEHTRRIADIEAVFERDRLDALDLDHRHGLGLATDAERKIAADKFERTRGALHREREALGSAEAQLRDIDGRIAVREAEINDRRDQQIERELPRALNEAATALFHAMAAMTRYRRLLAWSNDSS